MASLFILFLVVAVARASGGDEWQYKFAYTENINSQMSLECGAEGAIWIGWSHYGTRHHSPAERSHNDSPGVDL